MELASWNINGVKARLETVLVWLKEAAPDVACLQEIKSVDENFPREAFEEAGYVVTTHGQKGFNGVAILSKVTPEDVIRGLPGNEADEQARYLEAYIPGDGGGVRVASIYLPNGNPAPGPKYDYKLAWFDHLHARAEALLASEEPFVLMGDYNVIPEARDAKKIAEWEADALYLPASRQAFRRLMNLGFCDAVRTCTQAGGTYTFWDYQAGAWQRNNGIRIDHALLSPQAADRITGARIDSHVRDREKPSDHVPVVIALDA